MERSTLYNLLVTGILYDWQKEAEKSIPQDFVDTKKKREAELLAELSEEGKEDLCRYRLAIEERLEYIHYILGVKILNLGIQIGTEVKHSFIGEEMIPKEPINRRIFYRRLFIMINQSYGKLFSIIFFLVIKAGRSGGDRSKRGRCRFGSFAIPRA